MTRKKFWLRMLLMALALTTTLAGCGGDKKPVDGLKADVPAWLNDYPPEDALWGIGTAKTESDGESILLAEDRARTNIARQVETKAAAIYTEYSIDAFEDQPAYIFRTSKIVIGSSVIKRYKDKNGVWWCLVELSKENMFLSGIELAQNDIGVILRSNMENWPDIKNAHSTDNIPGWVFDAGTEDMMCGVGAAKLDNDEDAVYLAMERARRSLARSLSAEINAVFSDYSVNESQSYEEEGVSITSVYEYNHIQRQLLNLAKTKDGTLWVMLGYPKNQLILRPESSEDKLKREEAFKYLDEAFMHWRNER